MKVIRICLSFLVIVAYSTTALAESALPDCPANQSLRFDNCFGTYTVLDGGKYVGEWQDERKNGQGVFTLLNGEKYVGEFKDAMRNGQGAFTYANGEKYLGEWKDDKRNGQGTQTFPDGEKWSGYFMNDEYVPRICTDMGLTEGSSEHGQCVLKLMD